MYTLHAFRIRLIVLICTQLFLINWLSCQELELEVDPEYQLSQYHLGREDGLRGYLPHSFLQDHDGYIWVISNGWVQRYNGIRFETFWKVSEYSEKSFSLRVDLQGHIWVFSYTKGILDNRLYLEGLWVIFPDSGKVLSLEEVWEWQQLDFTQEEISAIAESKFNDRPVFGLTDGRVVDPAAGGKVLVDDLPDVVVKIAMNHQAVMVVNTVGALQVFDAEGEQLSSYEINDQRLFLLEINEKGDVLYSLDINKGIFYFIPLKEEAEKVTVEFLGEFFSFRSPNSSFEDSIYEVGCTVFLNENGPKPVLKSTNCLSFFIDRQRNIWTCNHNGVEVLQLRKRKFKTILTGNNTETRGILPLNDTLLLVHSYKGNFLVDDHNRIYDHIKSSAFYIGITRDTAGRIWQGIHGPEIGFIDDYNKSLYSIRLRPASLVPFDQDVFIPYVDGRNQLWLGTTGGACICPRQTGKVPYSFCKFIADTTLQRARVHYIKEVEGRIWAATSAGLFEIDPIAEKVLQHPPAMRNLNVNHFAVDGDTIWLSTYYHGLFRWEYSTGRLESIPFEKGGFQEIPSLCSVYDDGLGYLWLSSNIGLYRFNKANRTFQRYGIEQGVSHEEFNYYSHARLPDGRLAFGGLNGITLVDPQLILLQDQQEPAYHLAVGEAITIDGSTRKSLPIQNQEPISMVGQREDLEISWHLLDYRSKEKGQIIYRLAGLQQEWIPLEGYTLRLDRLPFGTYQLQVKALTFDELSNGNEWEFPVFIVRPWYRQWWFTGLLLLAGGGIIALRFRSVRRANDRLEKIVESRTEEIVSHRNLILDQNQELQLLNNYRNKIMAIMGHDLRGPILGLSNMSQKSQYLLSSGQTDRLFKLFNDNEKQLEHLRNLVDNILAWSWIQSKKDLKSNRLDVTLAEVVESQIDIVQSMAAIKEQKLEFIVEEECPVSQPEFVLGVLIRNVLTNSIRYSGIQ